MKILVLASLLPLVCVSCSNPDLPPTHTNTQYIGDPYYSPDAPKLLPFKDIKVDVQPPTGFGSYPKTAKDKGIHGDVLLEVWVNAKGIPTKAFALWGPKELHQSSIDYVLRWKFHPTQVAGNPIPVRFRMVMPFRLREGGVCQKLPANITY